MQHYIVAALGLGDDEHAYETCSTHNKASDALAARNKLVSELATLQLTGPELVIVQLYYNSRYICNIE